MTAKKSAQPVPTGPGGPCSVSGFNYMSCGKLLKRFEQGGYGGALLGFSKDDPGSCVEKRRMSKREAREEIHLVGEARNCCASQWAGADSSSASATSLLCTFGQVS